MPKPQQPPGKVQSLQGSTARLMSAITLRQIRYFVAVAETGQIGAAATLVSISPSAVTEAVRELESLTGATLFTRHQRGLNLTYDGHRFLGHCRNILSAVRNAAYGLGQPDTEVAGSIALATTITVAGYFLPPLLARFQKIFPKVQVHTTESKRSAVEAGLANGRFDLAIMLVSNLRSVDRLSSHTLVHSRRRLWLPPGHPLLAKETIDLVEVSQEPYIQLAIDDASKTTASYWMSKKLKPKVVFQTESVEAVRSLVAHGAGVTILSDLVYRPWSLEGDRIEVRDLEQPIPTMDVGLAWSKQSEPGIVAQAFIEFCKSEFSELPR